LKELGYSAAYSPIDGNQDDQTINAYAQAAQANDIVIAEVGVWNNPMSINEADRTPAIQLCKEKLALAEQLGAMCCVNISGSRGEIWDGPHPDNYSEDTFALVVDTVREIIDTVKPQRSSYSLEPMPWMVPDSPGSYLRLVEAIDRKAFSVHLDPVNWITSPQLYFHNGAFIEECFKKLGPYIKSCHVKDIRIQNKLTLRLDEVRPGLGFLDFKVLLTQAEKCSSELPMMLEHLESLEDYRLAADFVRTQASEIGVSFKTL
jgi:sugar phosphate isomerase/epimerase